MHLVYEFKDSLPINTSKINLAVSRLRILGVDQWRIYDEQKFNVPDMTKPYMEIDYKAGILKIRKLTDMPQEFIAEIESIMKGVYEYNPHQINHPPCHNCGKTARADYMGLCMDCADENGLSEPFIFEDTFIKNYMEYVRKDVLKVLMKAKDTELALKSIKEGCKTHNICMGCGVFVFDRGKRYQDTALCSGCNFFSFNRASYNEFGSGGFWVE